ncbi:hypothetical protein C8R46DRAFT_1226104 [Mycena filopes]|nr:hypothetical protein C8R46DRAFT_1226104 [Mycena filopes]
MPPPFAEQWDLVVAQAEIRALKTQLSNARVAMLEQDRITQLGVARLREKYSNARAALRIALDPLTGREDASSIDDATASREKKANLEQATGCAVCLEVMRNPDALTECGHTFCQDCLLNWFIKRRTCPTCVVVVDSPPNINGALETAIDGLVQAEIIDFDPARPSIPRRHAPY